jgi:hypothetical protein
MWVIVTLKATLLQVEQPVLRHGGGEDVGCRGCGDSCSAPPAAVPRFVAASVRARLGQ